VLPDRHYRWLVVLFSVVMQAVSVGILVYCFALFSLPWLDEFNASRRDVMITISCLQIGMGVMGPLLGRAIDVYSIRNIVLGGAVCLALGLWLVQHVSALWQLWLLYATLMPLATSMMGTLASQTLVAKWFHDQRGLALGVSAMGTNVGGMIFPLLVAGWLLDIGWRDTFGQLAVLSLVLVVPLAFIVLRREPPDVPVGSASGSDEPASVKIWTAKAILTTSLFWLPFLALIPLNMAFGALQFNLGGFARDAGLANDTAAMLVTVSSFCMIVGKLFFGSLGDRLDHRWLFWVANSVMVVALVAMSYADNYTTLMFAVVCMGLSGGGILPLMGLIFGARFGAASFGRVMGFVMLNVLFGAMAPVGAGWVYDQYGTYDFALWGMLCLVLPAMVAMTRLPQPETNPRLETSR
jgi:MFS family permease